MRWSRAARSELVPPPAACRSGLVRELLHQRRPQFPDDQLLAGEGRLVEVGVVVLGDVVLDGDGPGPRGGGLGHGGGGCGGRGGGTGGRARLLGRGGRGRRLGCGRALGGRRTAAGAVVVAATSATGVVAATAAVATG